MDPRPEGKVILLGGYGSFGSLIADQLAGSTQLVIAGRSPESGRRFADSLGAGFVECDARDQVSLRRAVSGARLVVNASGPFRAGDYSIPEVCIDEGCHYIDIADGRSYVAEIGSLNEKAAARGCFVCAGASTAPAVTSAMVAELAREMGPLASIEIAMSAGNKSKPGESTFASILSYAGAPIRVWQGGEWRELDGWGRAEFVRFPPPVGRRRVQLCDVADLELFPVLYGAGSVMFKAGVELNLFNYGLSALAGLRKRIPGLKLADLAGPLVKISRLFKMFGSHTGAITVTVVDRDGAKKSLTLVAPSNGPRIPTSPAVILARRLLAHGPPAVGAFPCVEFVSLQDLQAYLAGFGITVRS